MKWFESELSDDLSPFHFVLTHFVFDFVTDFYR